MSRTTFTLVEIGVVEEGTNKGEELLKFKAASGERIQINSDCTKPFSFQVGIGGGATSAQASNLVDQVIYTGFNPEVVKVGLTVDVDN